MTWLLMLAAWFFAPAWLFSRIASRLARTPQQPEWSCPDDLGALYDEIEAQP